MYSGSLQELTRNEQILVGTSSVPVTPARQIKGQERKVIIIRNISVNDVDIIYLSFGTQPAVAGTGVQLKRGDIYQDSTGENYEAYQDQINGICATANGILSIFER